MPHVDKAVIGSDMFIEGRLQTQGRLDIYGYVDGEVQAEHLVVHAGGRVFGTVTAERCDAMGLLQGTMHIKDLIEIASGAQVLGNVTYGQLALEAGGELSADVHNVPPTIGGDLEVSVARGQAVPITLGDLAAFDPDNAAHELVFTVSNTQHGFVSLTAAPTTPVRRFSQADLEAGNVLFRHDDSETTRASFDVVVADSHGATAGAAKTVKVSVK